MITHLISLYFSSVSLIFLYKPYVCDIILDKGMGKYKRKTEKKLVFMQAKMDEAKISQW
jgi:hypothetical protein